jgi:hypothetical protein
MIRFVLVGAEGAAEIEKEGTPGIRQATREEIEAWAHGWRAAHPPTDLQSIFIDGTGRPYWLMAVADDAPEPVKIRAVKFSRVLYLLHE